MITTILLTGPVDEVKLLIDFIRKLETEEQPTLTVSKKDGFLLIFQDYETAKKAFSKAKSYIKLTIDRSKVICAGNWLSFGSSTAKINR